MYEDINKTIEYIESHLYETLRLSDLANFVCYSKTHLSRQFNKYLGVSLRKYISRRRLSNAAIMVYSTNKSIEYIAHIHGFNSSKYFSTLFKKELGVSPRNYRERKSFIYLYPKIKIEGGVNDIMSQLKELVLTANVESNINNQFSVTLDSNKTLENRNSIVNTCIEKNNQNENVLTLELTVPRK